jgi:hypothetical protein
MYGNNTGLRHHEGYLYGKGSFSYLALLFEMLERNTRRGRQRATLDQCRCDVPTNIQLLRMLRRGNSWTLPEKALQALTFLLETAVLRYLLLPN